MKNYLLFLFVMLLQLQLNAQTLFAPPNSVWNYEFLTDVGVGYYKYVRYETIKDTLFMGKTCSKILGRHIKKNFSGAIVDTTYEKPNYTYVNGDTVFYYNYLFDAFCQLYNFNVKVGDTVTYHVPYIAPGTTDTTFKVIIDEVSTISINGISCRMIKSSSMPLARFAIGTLIERLGSIPRLGETNGSFLIGHTNTSVPASSGGELRCYKDGQIDTNLSVLKLDCNLLSHTAIMSNKQQLNDIKLSPNPSQGIFSIEIPSPLEGKIQLTIINVFGQKIDALVMAQNKTLLIDISTAASGFYLLKLQAKGEADTRTFTLLKN